MTKTSLYFTAKKAYIDAEKECGIKVGDTVQVTAVANTHEYGWDNNWTPTMNALIGQRGLVKEIKRTGTGIAVEFVQGTDIMVFYLPFFVLEVVKSTKKRECKFKPFDKVLVRNSSGGEWRPDIYRWYRESGDGYNYCTMTGAYVQCIAYDKDLDGKTDCTEEE